MHTTINFVFSLSRKRYLGEYAVFPKRCMTFWAGWVLMYSCSVTAGSCLPDEMMAKASSSSSRERFFIYAPKLPASIAPGPPPFNDKICQWLLLTAVFLWPGCFSCPSILEGLNTCHYQKTFLCECVTKGSHVPIYLATPGHAMTAHYRDHGLPLWMIDRKLKGHINISITQTQTHTTITRHFGSSVNKR